MTMSEKFTDLEKAHEELQKQKFEIVDFGNGVPKLFREIQVDDGLRFWAENSTMSVPTNEEPPELPGRSVLNDRENDGVFLVEEYGLDELEELQKLSRKTPVVMSHDEFTSAQIKKYLEDSSVCPFCNEKGCIEGWGKEEMDFNIISVKVGCTKCEKPFWEVYELHSIDMVRV
jgi:hypothetical protein